MPTGTNPTYVSAAGTGHYPLPLATDTRYRKAHTPQQPKPSGLDWDALTPTGDTRPVRCRWCRHISTQLDDDQLCPDCLNVAVQAPSTSEPVAKQEAPALTVAELVIVARIEAAPDALADDQEELPMEGKQGQPTPRNSAPRQESTSTAPTGRAPVAGPSTHQEKDPAADLGHAPQAAAGLPVPAYAAQLLTDTAHHPLAAVQALRSSILGALAALDLLTNPHAPVAAPAPQVSSDPPGSSDLPDAATGTTPPAGRRVMGDWTGQTRARAPRPPRQGTFPLGKAKQLYAEGLSCPQIAREIGSSATYVRTKLKEAGVQMRDDRTRNSGGSNRRTPDQDDPTLVARFRELYLDHGLTIHATADQLGIGYKAASNLMARHGIQARPPANKPGQPTRWQKITDTQAAEIAQRYTAGESTLALAKAYGVSSNSIGNILDRQGIPRRTASQARQLALANGARRIDGASIVAAQLRDLGVTAAEVRFWAHAQGLVDDIKKTGVPARHLVDAYAAAHPTNQSGDTTP